MKGPTHLLIGLAITVPVAMATNQPLILVAGMLGGLWPDLDSSETTLTNWRFQISGGRGKERVYLHPFRAISGVTSLFTKHRGSWHSGLAVLIWFAIFSLIGGWAFGLAFALAYASHLLLDAMTPAGIPLWGGKKWYVLPERYRIKTGDDLEHLVSAVGILVLLLYFGWMLSGNGLSPGNLYPR